MPPILNRHRCHPKPMPTIFVDHIDDSRLDAYRDLRTQALTRHSGRFIVEGARLVRRLLASRFPIESALLGENQADALVDEFPAECPIYVTSKENMRRLVGYPFHLGSLGCGRRLPSAGLEALLKLNHPECLLLVCPRMIDPENLGAVIRVGAAFGVDGILLGRGCADPFSRRVVRVSMGNVLSIPIRESDDLEADVRALRKSWNVIPIASVLDPAAEQLEKAARPARMALLLGNETEGLDPCWLDLCPRQVTIPMQGGTDSLNVAVAAGVMLYHFTRAAATD
jgi:tRNA G18 (ribose-2'-O)-methylase SpoU